ncbi:kunitz-type serine protease inhibitor 87-like [Eublepharis macularius]|uniref:Kunitz-type serine protease inhibitor 87-like n=1 Tax=Eublepharis macularius TaxID=481883 RepID=A0AA97JGG2_EUBMA|nr:kunitz-type serine protease inhibitor 87-like [Eublepharis macularius]
MDWLVVDCPTGLTMQLDCHLLLLGLLAFWLELTLVAAQKRPDLCFLPKKVGPCKALKPRFFYNSSTQNCEHFFYGGCKGNANNFKTLEECQRTCEKPGGEKPGTCPMFPAIVNEPCVTQCLHDGECSGEAKCCSRMCSMVCLKPHPELP